MLEWIDGAIEALGYWGIALLMFLENVFPPLPSELIMPLAGFTASQGRLSFLGVVLAGISGSLIGQLPIYYVARRLGKRRVEEWIAAHGRWFKLSAEDLERAQSWFNRHGGSAVFLARLMPGLRSLISIPAGLARMSVLWFLLYSGLGISIWTTVLVTLGWFLRQNYRNIRLKAHTVHGWDERRTCGSPPLEHPCSLSAFMLD